MTEIIGEDWGTLLAAEWEKPYFKQLFEYVISEYETAEIYPPENRIFDAFRLTPYADTRVVIVGQDPYHGEGLAHGLAFSVPDGVKPPPSLVNIFREIDAECGTSLSRAKQGNLTNWTQQGVLLLNSVLTVRKEYPGSHRGKGWETLTDSVLRLLNDSHEPIVFMLWGNAAKKKQGILTNPWHLVLTAAHPSPLSASGGFLGCGHFRKANEFFERRDMDTFDWERL